MHSKFDALQILNLLRQAKSSRAKLADILPLQYGSRPLRGTRGGIIGAAIAGLIDTDLVELYGKDTNITSIIQSIGDRRDLTLSRGYKIAAELAGLEQQIEVVLTDRLPYLQEVLGISITQLLDDCRDDAIRVRPLFGKPGGAPKSDVFVLMPFRSELLPIYDDHIKSVCDHQKLSCVRADDLFGSKKIIDEVWELIANSKLLVADCTGRNPNVFYELGIGHTLGKKVILITQSEDDIPFDIRHLRYIKYEYTPRGMKAFESTLSAFISEELKHEA